MYKEIFFERSCYEDRYKVTIDTILKKANLKIIYHYIMHHFIKCKFASKFNRKE